MAEKLIASITTHLIQPAIKLMFIIAALVFIWGVVEMIMNSSESEAHEKGAKHIMWGLIGLLIMFGVYGILGIIVNTLKGVS